MVLRKTQQKKPFRTEMAGSRSGITFAFERFAYYTVVDIGIAVDLGRVLPGTPFSGILYFKTCSSMQSLSYATTRISTVSMFQTNKIRTRRADFIQVLP